MTLKTTLAKDTVVRVPNKIETLDRMAKTISDKGISILAVSSWAEGDQGRQVRGA